MRRKAKAKVWLIDNWDGRIPKQEWAWTRHIYFSPFHARLAEWREQKEALRGREGDTKQEPDPSP